MSALSHYQREIMFRIVCFYQDVIGRCESETHKYVTALSNDTALQSARDNAHVLGVDAKHGVQADGACLLTTVTQHKEGFGCPAGYFILNRENQHTIKETIQSLIVIDNIPCADARCDHVVSYEDIPNGAGVRRCMKCSLKSPYKPILMIDKHDPTLRASLLLGLIAWLCWFHITVNQSKTLNFSF